MGMGRRATERRPNREYGRKPNILLSRMDGTTCLPHPLFCQRHVIEILKLSRKLFMSSIVSYRQLKCISAQSLLALLQTGQWVAVRGRLKPIQTGRRGDLIYDQSPLTNIARIALGDNGELQQYWVAQGRFNEAGTSVGAYFRRGDLPFYAAKAPFYGVYVFMLQGLARYFVHSGRTRRKV